MNTISVPKWLTSPGFLVCAWIITRTLFLLRWVILREHYQEIHYYQDGAQTFLGSEGLASALVEYPAPAVWLCTLPELLGGPSFPGYSIAFLAMLLVFDAIAAAFIWRSSGSLGFWVWSGCLLVAGQVYILRIDIASAALVAISMAIIFAPNQFRSRFWDGLSAACLAVAVGFKLWPIVLAPLLLRHRSRVVSITTFAVTGSIQVSATLWLGGVGRLLSPLTWQTGRGLQMEAIPATPHIVARHLISSIRTDNGPNNSIDIYGPGVRTIAQLAGYANLFVMAAAFALCLWWALSKKTSLISGIWIPVAAVSWILVTNKVFSPQYVLWLVAVIAVAVGHGYREKLYPGVTTAISIGIVLITVLTTLVFPFSYFFFNRTDYLGIIASTELFFRNIGIALIAAVSLWLTRELYRSN